MAKYEPLDLVEAAFIGRGPMGIFATMILDGHIDVDRLSEAVTRVGSVVPETLCRLDDHHMRFLPVPSPDVIREVTGLVEAGFEWDPTSDTQVKILVGHGFDTDSIVLGMTHMVTDGIGMVQYMSLLADAYNGNLPDLHNQRSINVMLRDVKVGEPTQAELAAEKLAPQSFGLPDSGNEHLCRRFTIPPEVMDAIHAMAREHGVTLNDIFLAACVRVISRNLHARVIYMPCPVDMRKLDDVGSCTVANMSGLYMSSFTVEDGDSFSTTVQSVHREITELQERNRSLAAIAKFAPICRASPVWLAKWMVRRNMLIPAIVYTNFGVLEPLQFGECRAVTYYMTGAYRTNYQIGLNISTFMGTTSFVHTLIGDEEGAEAAEEIVHEILAECELWSR